MKVSKAWLKELVEIKDIQEVERLLPLRTIGTKEVTADFIELDMKGYNRADLLSLRGVAYEVAAITDTEVKFSEPQTSDYIWVSQTIEGFPVEVKDSDKCPLYCVAKIEGLKVGPSDPSWTKKLADSGFRTINNIADVTNLVMLEYGQPLHSFDADKVQNKIIVRAAEAGEKILTIDHKERALTESNLVIADEKGAIAIAGVMGGTETEISSETTSILLEAAIFDPISVRETTQSLGLPSEASKRFQHGLTQKRLLQALDAAIQMYQSLGGKLTALTIRGELPERQIKIPLRLAKTNSLIGTDLNKKEIENYLAKLHFECQEESSGWVVTPPYWRLDTEIEEDLIEEVARLYGYEKIPAHELPESSPNKIDQTLFEIISNIKSALADSGLYEVQTYSFYSTKLLGALDYSQEDLKTLVKVKNPMSAETEYLRLNLWPSLLEVVDKNLRQGREDIAIFEVGKIFYYNQDNQIAEKYALSIALMNGTDNPMAELNAIFDKLNEELKLGIEVEAKDTPQSLGYFHPKRFVQFSKKGVAVGGMAEVHKRVTDKLGLNKRVAVLEIGIPKLL